MSVAKYNGNCYKLCIHEHKQERNKLLGTKLNPSRVH
jgi:hypothetical protein